MSTQKELSAERVCHTEDDELGAEDDDDLFTRESREIGVEFVKLLLGDMGRKGEAMGPGDGRLGVVAADSTEETSCESRSSSSVNMYI